MNLFSTTTFSFPLPLSNFLSRLHHLTKAVEDAQQLEPREYCSKWVRNPSPGEWGHYRACVKALAKAIGLSERTIEGWGKDFGKRPDYVLVVLSKDDALREIKKLISENLDED